jgi:hypothetical protein
MFLFSQRPQRNRCGSNGIIVCIFLSSFIGRNDSLTLPFRRLRPTSASMAADPSGGGRIKRRLDIHHSSDDGDADFDVDVDSKYAYVHPSIREVLVMEPRDIPLDFLESGRIDAKNDDVIMVNMEAYTIQWNVLDEFLENENSKGKAPELQNTISMEQLVTLASQCDAALFKDYNKLPCAVVPSPIRGLLRILPEECRVDQKHRISEDGGAHCLIATLLALNMVENSIRHLIGKKNGKAPLLKDMIEIMAAREGENALPKLVVPVLRTLLLPINGLNLRNVVWHGFLPTIPRRWFALSVVLTLSLDELEGSSSFETASFDRTPNTIASMRKHKTLVTVLDHGKGILASPKKLSSLQGKMIQSKNIPRSHMELFRVSLKFVHQPIIFASVVGPLIEHLLRLMWCHENRQNKQIAEPGSYYVTLDGIGQKDKHEIVIMPFFCQPGVAKEARNQLVCRLGGSTMAFLMDMFTSPSGGPNIRATVAHGSFNKYLFKELVAIEGERDGMESNAHELRDMTSALLSVLSVLCEDGQYTTTETDVTGGCEGNTSLGSYRPCFSYTALLHAEVGNMVNSMESLYDFIRGGHHLKYSINASQSQMQIEIAHKVAATSQSFEAIVGMQKRIWQNFGTTESKFTDESFFQESSNNSIASECGAAKLLLSEIAEAAFSSLQDLNDGISAFQCEEIELSSRRRKQVSRICATAQLTLDFYSFAAYCALLYIERRQDTAKVCKNIELQRKIDESPTNDELFVAVKRSRMVMSTFSSTKAFDRALSALAQYTSGKAVKAVSESIRNSLIQRPGGEIELRRNRAKEFE